jgi:hypothetical protein
MTSTIKIRMQHLITFCFKIKRKEVMMENIFSPSVGAISNSIPRWGPLGADYHLEW